jgi:Tfp pilus assembly protein PilX
MLPIIKMKNLEKIFPNKNLERGNILFTSILLLLVMNLLGVALVQMSTKEFNQADFKNIDSNVFYLAESCNQDAISWIKSNTTPPNSLPYTITKQNLEHLFTGDETQATENKLSNYSYNCTISEVTAASVLGDSIGTGESVGMETSYGTSGDLTPTYYYQITANGVGPRNSTKTVYTLLSAEF